jgi:hypothetical protein
MAGAASGFRFHDLLLKLRSIPERQASTLVVLELAARPL